MDFERIQPLAGDPAKVLHMALYVLGANGFRVTQQGREFAEFEGTGMVSTKQASVLGASRIRIDVERHQVRLRALLGGVRRMKRLIIFLPLGLGVFFLLLFAVLFRDMGWGFVVLVSLAPVAPWLVLAPWLNRWIQRRTELALDTLLANLIAAATRPHP